MTKTMTRNERERISNRLILNFGILLCGALVMLYIYNFVNAGYSRQVACVVGALGILSLIGAAIFFFVGKKNESKIKNYSGIFLGSAIASLITCLPKINFIAKFLPGFTMKNAIVTVFILMLLYFVVLCIVTAVILNTHPEAQEKKKIQHPKKKKSRR
ncbi:MAG: hypothetical protein IKU87_01145 [Clostridia bacterium]|nr:hypothetical protein [Clostridia bacterium]